MIYNLMEYIDQNLVGESIYINATAPTVPDRFILLVEFGGTSSAWYKYITKTVQVITRDIDSAKSKELNEDVYELIDNKFGLILPAVTVGGKLYNEIQTAQISANNEPQFSHLDEKGNVVYSTNYRVIYSKE